MTPAASTKAAQPATYFIQLDGLRFVAVSLVMLDHWLGERSPLPLGYFGVNLFFVLSGFLITRILITSKQADQAKQQPHWRSLGRFYIRRSLRIFPVYYLTLFGLALVHFPAVRDHLGWLLTYTQNIWIAIHHTWLGAIDHLWSLAVEEQYYLFFPFLIFFTPDRYLLKTLLALMALSVGLRGLLYLVQADYTVQFVLMPTCLDAFGMGGLLAYGYLFYPNQFALRAGSTRWLLASLALYLLDLYLMKTLTPTRNVFTDVFDRLFTSLFCCFLIGKGITGYTGLVRWGLVNPVSNYLGRISYGLYLFHNLVFNAYHTPTNFITVRLWQRLCRAVPLLTSDALQTPANVLFFYALTVGVATMSWYGIERPFNAMKKRVAYHPGGAGI